MEGTSDDGTYRDSGLCRTSDAHMTLYGVAVIGFGGRCEWCDPPRGLHFHSALENVLCGVDSKNLRMEQRELRQDRHTVSLLTDHMVITPKYRGKILVGDVALAVEGIIRTTCKEMKIEIIDMAVNIDHVHLFIEYLPKYSVSFIAKKIKGRSSRILRQNFPHFERMMQKSPVGLPDVILAQWVTGGKLWRSTSGRKIMRERTNRYAQTLCLSAGYSDFGRLK